MDERKLRAEWEIWIRRLFYSDYFKCGKVPREGKANKERKLIVLALMEQKQSGTQKKKIFFLEASTLLPQSNFGEKKRERKSELEHFRFLSFFLFFFCCCSLF